MTHDDHRAALALHALDATEGPERLRLDAHLARCPSCAAEHAAFADVSARLALLAAPIAPPPGHLERLLNVLDADAGPCVPSAPAAVPTPPPVALRRERRWIVPARRAAVAAAVVLLVTSEIGLVRRLDRAERDLVHLRRLGAFVTSPTVSVVPLWGARPAAGPLAKLAYDHRTGRFVLLSSELTPPPDGMRYQLWVIADGVRPASLTLAGSPDGRLDLPPGDGPFLFGLSVEPAGEVDEPTGPMMLMSAALHSSG